MGDGVSVYICSLEMVNEPMYYKVNELMYKPNTSQWTYTSQAFCILHEVETLTKVDWEKLGMYNASF